MTVFDLYLQNCAKFAVFIEKSIEKMLKEQSLIGAYLRGIRAQVNTFHFVEDNLRDTSVVCLFRSDKAAFH